MSHMTRYYLFTLFSLLLLSFESTKSEKCNMKKLIASYPINKTVSQAGFIEKWDEDVDQMQCTGTTAIKITLKPEGLSLPNFDPVPRLSYIIQGTGVVGIAYPWCPSTFHAEETGDVYQKTFRVKKGDVVAVPPSVVHWCYNDGDEDLVAITLVDLNSGHNQLDTSFKIAYLAGDAPGWLKPEQTKQTNIISPFDTNHMAEAMGISIDLMQKIQRKDERGVMIKVKKEEMRAVGPQDEEVNMNLDTNGVEETLCRIRLMLNIDTKRDIDIYSRKAGKLNAINKSKLPMLDWMDLSAEKGSLRPNAFLAPNWLINAHTILFVTRGEGNLQVVDSEGKNVYNDIIREGQLTIIPQLFASMLQAGSRGIDWISFMTSSLPMRSPIIGPVSNFKAMPEEVMANSYRVATSEVLKLKYCRENYTVLFPPLTTP